MNLVLVILSAFLALGAAVNAGAPVTAVSGSVSAAVATPTPTPAPPHYDVIGSGGPT